jgi:glycosyltransferase involved in cell wall biosynthesis
VTAAHDRIHRRLEAGVVRTARAVVTLNPLHTADLAERFPGATCETIENGFDPSDYDVRPAASSGRIFTYAGAIYGYQGPEPFLRALEATGRRDVEVRIVGDRFSGYRGGGWPFRVTVEGHLPHRDLGRVFSETAAFFLCLEPPAARQLPAKLYEYLRAGRPTFAIVPRGGAVDQWIARTGAGTAVPSEDPASWAPALERFIADLPLYRPPDGSAFHRRALAGRLAEVLDEAAART